MGKAKVLCAMWKRGKIMRCMICGHRNASNNTVRNVNLYVNGSEGLDICHECEMRLVTYIRSMRELAASVTIKIHKDYRVVESAIKGER